MILGPTSSPAAAATGGTLTPLLATIHLHLTLSEAVKVAARDG